MSQILSKKWLYEYSNRITQMIVTFIMLICLLLMTPIGFNLYVAYALPMDIAFLVISFLCSDKSSMYMGKRSLLNLIFILACFALTLPINNGGIGSVFAPMLNILWVQVMCHCKLTAEMICNIKRMFFLLFIVSLVHCPDYFAKWTASGESGMNPNTLAFLIALSSAFILIFGSNSKIYRKYHFLIPQLLLTFWGILNCGSRASLLMFMVFVVFKCLMPMKLKQSKRVTVSIYIIFVIAGFLFPMFYIYLSNNARMLNIPVISSLISQKSFFTGRERIWGSLFSEFSKNKYSWLFGLGSKITNTESSLNNPHNSYMLILMDFGLLGLAAYYSFYIFYLRSLYNRGKLCCAQIDLIYLALSFFVLNFFEVTLLWHPFIVIISFIWGIPQGLKHAA